MRWRLSDEYKMGAVMTAAGSVLAVLNARLIPTGSLDLMGIASLVSALFVLVLGIALLFEKEPSE